MASDDPAGLDAAVEAAANFKPGDPWPEAFLPGRLLTAAGLNELIAERIRIAAPHIRRAVLEEAADDLDAEAFAMEIDDDRPSGVEYATMRLRDRAGEGGGG